MQITACPELILLILAVCATVENALPARCIDVGGNSSIWKA